MGQLDLSLSVYTPNRHRLWPTLLKRGKGKEVCEPVRQ